MPRRTTLAALAGLGVGITVALTATAHAPDNRELAAILTVAGERLLPLLLVTVIALTAVKGWLDRHDDLTHRRFSQLLTERRGAEELHERRQRDLDQREAALNRAAELAHLQQADVLRQLNEARGALDAERAAHQQTRADYDEVTEERNELIRQAMQESADRFSQRPRTTGPVPAPAAVSLLRAPRRPAPASPADVTAAGTGDTC